MTTQKFWNEFLKKLAIYEQETFIRTKEGHDLYARMPAQEVLESLQNECLDLTTDWYGKANCSALYAAFLRMCETSGIASYPYSALPMKISADGYLYIFDAEYRDSFLIKNNQQPFSLEKLTQRRFLPFNWQRTYPLESAQADNKTIVLRSQNTIEIARFCMNSAPYQQLHGLGIGAYTDNAVCDIEKIAQEAEFLNPLTTKPMLAGEIKFNVGQNSYTGSSIPFVLHSHHSIGTIDQFKIYIEPSSKIIEITKFNGLLEIIQPGTKVDGFFIKITTPTVTQTEYLAFCLGLRLHLERIFSTAVIDFHFHIIPTNDGRFVTIMAPFAKLVQSFENTTRIFTNPETGANHIEMRVAPHLHLGNASNKWTVKYSNQTLLNAYIENGRGRLAALYDFTAKSGTRAAVQDYISSTL